MATQSDYIEEIILNVYRLEGATSAHGGNIGTQNEVRLSAAMNAIIAIIDKSRNARGEKP